MLLVLYSVVGVLGAPLSIATDHVSRRALASGGAIGYGAGFLVMVVGPGFASLLVGISVASVASGVMIDATEVALADLAEDEDHLRALLGQQNVLAAVGSIGGPLILAATLAAGLGWRMAFAAAAGLLFAYGGLLATQPVPPPADGSDDEEALAFWAGLRAVAGDRRVWGLGVVLLLLNPFDEPFLGFAIAYFDQHRGHSAAVATLVGGAATVGGIAGAAGAAWAGRRFGGRTQLFGATVVAGGVVLVAVGPLVLFQGLGASLVGAGLYLVWVDLQARTLLLRPGQAGATGSLVDLVSQPGAVLPLAIGHLADRFGLPAAMAAFLVLAAALVAAAALLGRSELSCPIDRRGGGDRRS